MPREKLIYSAEYLENVDGANLSPATFVNWRNLDCNTLIEGPPEVHLFIDLPWIYILKIIIEVRLTNLFFVIKIYIP